MIRNIYKFLTSAKLALILLIVILACCVIGVTVYRGAKAGEMIFATLWFNGLLVILVINIAFCFFPRIWGRRLTVVSVGMILFHLSFVAMLLGIVYNSLFHFHGIIRLAEGEVLPQGDPVSWDAISQGRFFDISRLKGDITLIQMRKGYEIDGKNKMVAYEGVIYITHRFSHNGFSYFREKEGYSILIVLYDRHDNWIYGFYVPLQSYRQAPDNFLYSTGLKEKPGSFPFPQGALDPQFFLQAIYYPDPEKERAGEVRFAVWPLPGEEMNKADSSRETALANVPGQKKESDPHGGVPGMDKIASAEGTDPRDEKPLFEGKVLMGEKFRAGDYSLAMEEVRYWAAMSVRYDPGKLTVLTALWVGLGGMIITFFGRLMRRSKKS